MFKLGPWEIVLIVAVVLIIFGPKRLPELGKGIGQFFKNFKKSVSGEPEEKEEKKKEE
ncbi:MAG: twin-arginine translocase TatA/TatE family subunit [Deltaproteobacteria bacterium]|nr:twin-arginine translocase TatA/TatE family subunit [Deltaproteobacteria bacterium]